jgi:hypothetical protein
MRMPTLASFLSGLTNFIDAVPPPWVLLPLALLTQPILALVHELGHGAAALALLPGRVTVAIGRTPPLVTCNAQRMTIAFHPVAPFWRNSATCAWDGTASPTQAALIASAGPAASLLTCIVAWSALLLVGPSLLRDLLWVMAFVSLGSALGNLVPFTFKDSRGTPRRSDGAIIVAALR